MTPEEVAGAAPDVTLASSGGNPFDRDPVAARPGWSEIAAGPGHEALLARERLTS